MGDIETLRSAVRNIPDFPKPGILFRDITPLLGDPALFRAVIRLLVAECRRLGATRVVGIDARGFLFGATVAHELGVGFAPVRKKGKLPFDTISQSYDLEYGSAELEIHVDGVAAGDKVALIDDLLATGGTASAAIQLIHKLGAEVVEALFVIELRDLGGRASLGGVPAFTILDY